MSRPYVLINVALTADGKLDTYERRGATISSERDKERVDRLRAEADAILIGGHTLLGDDPQLTVKSAALRAERVAQGQSENPIKVAIVSQPRLRPTSRFLTSGPARVILFTLTTTSPETTTTLQAQGIEVYLLGEKQVDLAAALSKLSELGIKRLLVEGGGTLNFELLRLGLVDEVRLYLAPLIFGGATAPTLAAGVGFSRAEAVRLKQQEVEVWEEGGIVVRYLCG